jgi:hypothetical protein
MLGVMQTASVTADRVFSRLRLFVSHLTRWLAHQRAERARIEAELFEGRYHLSSKNDDDLPLTN